MFLLQVMKVNSLAKIQKHHKIKRKKPITNGYVYSRIQNQTQYAKINQSNLKNQSQIWELWCFSRVGVNLPCLKGEGKGGLGSPMRGFRQILASTTSARGSFTFPLPVPCTTWLEEPLVPMCCCYCWIFFFFFNKMIFRFFNLYLKKKIVKDEKRIIIPIIVPSKKEYGPKRTVS